MDRLEIIEKLKDLDVEIGLLEDGINAHVFIRDECLEAFLAIIELTEKLENS